MIFNHHPNICFRSPLFKVNQGNFCCFGQTAVSINAAICSAASCSSTPAHTRTISSSCCTQALKILSRLFALNSLSRNRNIILDSNFCAFLQSSPAGRICSPARLFTVIFLSIKLFSRLFVIGVDWLLGCSYYQLHIRNQLITFRQFDLHRNLIRIWN